MEDWQRNSWVSLVLIIAVLATLGNAGLLRMVYKQPVKTSLGLFLANMALSDILFLVAYVPLVSVLATMGDRLVITKSDCLPLGIFASVCYYASVLATLGVVAERCVTLYNPRYVMKKCVSRACVGMVWATTGFLAYIDATVFSGYGSSSLSNSNGTLSYQDCYYRPRSFLQTLLFVLMAVFPCLVALVIGVTLHEKYSRRFYYSTCAVDTLAMMERRASKVILSVTLHVISGMVLTCILGEVGRGAVTDTSSSQVYYRASILVFTITLFGKSILFCVLSQKYREQNLPQFLNTWLMRRDTPNVQLFSMVTSGGRLTARRDIRPSIILQTSSQQADALSCEGPLQHQELDKQQQQQQDDVQDNVSSRCSNQSMAASNDLKQYVNDSPQQLASAKMLQRSQSLVPIQELQKPEFGSRLLLSRRRKSTMMKTPDNPTKREVIFRMSVTEPEGYEQKAELGSYLAPISDTTIPESNTTKKAAWPSPVLSSSRRTTKEADIEGGIRRYSIAESIHISPHFVNARRRKRSSSSPDVWSTSSSSGGLIHSPLFSYTGSKIQCYPFATIGVTLPGLVCTSPSLSRASGQHAHLIVPNTTS